ncbi:protein ESMERALDA 1 [Cryptomeria japonica]|uniref:protein ESMERALDA 1 n=1 Tax=Cryptomeria japonica TaxID=3369 RepID=UPI0027DA52FA|nr:protein ESMERALDA 1 [Cryptomeria japonica]XP_057812565.2 protein ESMERALDA 1 [Cryptomeria japonica]
MVEGGAKAKMYPYTRLNSSPSPSPPSSPRSPRRYGHQSRRPGRSRSGGRAQPFPPGTSLMQRLLYFVLSIMLRRQGVLLFAPLIYMSVMLLYMGTVPFQVPGVVHRTLPGSVYRSPQLFHKLWPAMQSNNSTANALLSAWEYPREGEGWRPCLDRTSLDTGLPNSNGYLVIEANGGLNQQRNSICNAVAVAGVLNATLVIPSFHLNSVWKDHSKFRDIFDEEHFINTLRNDVRVVRKLPEAVMERFNYNMSSILNLRVKAWSPVGYYLEKVLPKLIENGVIRIAPFANRLSPDVPLKVQRLRCLADYEALRFSEPISAFANKLVDRMVEHSSNSSGKYISVHLRFEEDMVAFSCCVYDGGKEEKQEMDDARERGWRGKFNRTGRVIRPGAIRMDGKCPLTPLEVGLMLRGMGFDNNTSIYLASGKIYKAEKYMVPLLQMFPLLQTKETLASAEELAPFKDYSSRMAALDYTVCLHSEVFVTTQGGNFPHFLMGHRRYLYKGHSKTIKPDKRKLAILLDNPDIRWENFRRHLQAMRRHSDVKGVEIRKANASIYTFPTPDCMCREKT